MGGTKTAGAQVCAGWVTSTLRRLLAACALALVAASAHAAAADAHATSDTLYFTITGGTPVYSMGFHYDGTGNVTLDPSHRITDLGHQGDGLAFARDGDLLVGAPFQSVDKVNIGNGTFTHQTQQAGGAGQVAHVSVDPSRQKVWGTYTGGITEFPLSPAFADGTEHDVTGDSTDITTLGFTPDGHAYYSSSDGSFGSIDLSTFQTTRLIAACPTNPDNCLGSPMHSFTYDSYTGDIIGFGTNHVVQIRLTPTPHIVSQGDLQAPVGSLDQGTVDGRGHLYVGDNGGYIVFVDYAASHLIGDAGNFVKAVQPSMTDDASPVDPGAPDDVAPLSGFGARDQTPPQITISAPASGATYTQGQQVAAAYGCQDAEAGHTGVAACAGANDGQGVASGGALDTSTLGTHHFTVSASDYAGNASQLTHAYEVVAAQTGDGGGGGGGGGTRGIDTTSIGTVPNVKGLRLDVAKHTFDKTGLSQVDFDLKFAAQGPKNAKLGAVIAQSPAPGKRLTNGVNQHPKVSLTVFKGDSDGACTSANLKSLKGEDFASAAALLRQLKCKVTYNIASGGNSDSVGKPKNTGGKHVALPVTCSAKGAGSDFVYEVQSMSAQTGTAGFSAKDGQLTKITKGPEAGVRFQVFDRAGTALRNAHVILELSDVGAKDQNIATDAHGRAYFRSKTPKAGKVDFCIVGVTADDQAFYSGGQLTVADRGSTGRGKELGLTNGRTMQKAGVGSNWKLLDPDASDSRVRAAGFFDFIGSVFQTIFNGVTSLPANIASLLRGGNGASLAKLSNQGIQVGTISAGGVVSVGSGNVVSVGAGNVVSVGAGNVVSVGSGNLIPLGTANVVGVGSGNVVSVGAGNVIGQNTANMSTAVSQTVPGAVGNVVSVGAGNVVSVGSGNLIPLGTANVVSVGAGNLTGLGPGAK